MQEPMVAFVEAPTLTSQKMLKIVAWKITVVIHNVYLITAA
jgi:hypothetical protein